MIQSPLQKKILFGRTVYIKRDDLIQPYLNGNKARKMHFLMTMPPKSINGIVSCGGYQSNAMFALSLLARQKKWTFQYYCPTIPGRIKQNPGGNLKHSLDNGMILKETPHELYQKTIFLLKAAPLDPESIFIPQGAHCQQAESGVAHLARELANQIQNIGLHNADMVLSSGTGTTAYFLAKHLPQYRVITFPSVGNSDYLREQMLELGQLPGNLVIWEPFKKISFGATDPDVYAIYQELSRQGMEFDLLYDCPAWLQLQNSLPQFSGREIIFIHSGGLHGNPTLLARYKREFGKI